MKDGRHRAVTEVARAWRQQSVSRATGWTDQVFHSWVLVFIVFWMPYATFIANNHHITPVQLLRRRKITATEIKLLYSRLSVCFGFSCLFVFFGGGCPLFVPPTHRQMLFEDMTQDLHWMDEHTFKRYFPHFVFQPHIPYNRKDLVKDKSVSSYSIGWHQILTPTGVIEMLPWWCVQVLFKCYVHIPFKASHCVLLCFYSLDSFRH